MAWDIPLQCVCDGQGQLSLWAFNAGSRPHSRILRRDHPRLADGASLMLTQLDSALIRIMGIVGIVKGERCVVRAMARCNQRQQSLLADASCTSDMPLQLW